MNVTNVYFLCCVASGLSFNNLKHQRTKAVKNICIQEKIIPWLAALIGFQTYFSIGYAGLERIMLTNLQNASCFDNLRVRKISTIKFLRVRIMLFSQTFRKNFLVV